VYGGHPRPFPHPFPRPRVEVLLRSFHHCSNLAWQGGSALVDMLASGSGCGNG